MHSGKTASRVAPGLARGLPALALVLGVGGVALLFALSFGAHGYAPTDQGFVLGQSYRITGGQVPYRDFIYVRAPGSLYLHTVWFVLPEPWVFRAGRFAYYAQLAVAALAPALFALRAGLVASPLRLVLLCVTFYVVGLHNFPPMPWYTVDGVFFSSLGLVAVLASQRAPSLSRALSWRALGSLLLALASLAKQNYAALPALLVLVDAGVAVVAVAGAAPEGVARARVLKLLASALPAALVFCIVAWLLAAVGAWEPFLVQVGAASSLSGLLDVGLLSWVTVPVAVATCVGFALHRFGALRAGEARGALLERAAAVAPPLLLGALAWQVEPRTGHVLFAAILGASLSSLASTAAHVRDDPAAPPALLAPILQIGTLAVAWSASISFGAETPLLGLAAAGAAVETLLPAPAGAFGRRVPPLACLGVVAALAVVRVWGSNAEHPYRSVPRAEQTRAYHEIFPRFGKLYGGELLGDRMVDLAGQVERHALAQGRDFTVVPGFPLVHFLVDRQTRAPMDWYVVFDLFNLRSEVVARLRAFDGVVLLERPPSEAPCTGREFANVYRGLSSRIFREGRLLASSRYFCLVEPGPSSGR